MTVLNDAWKEYLECLLELLRSDGGPDPDEGAIRVFKAVFFMGAAVSHGALTDGDDACRADVARELVEFGQTTPE